MKKINRTLLLLAGIAANVLLACGSSEDKASKEPYSGYDTLQPVEQKNDGDTLRSGQDTIGNRQMAE